MRLHYPRALPPYDVIAALIIRKEAVTQHSQLSTYSTPSQLTLSGEIIPFNQAYDTAPWLQMVITFRMGQTLVMASLPKVQLPTQKRT